MRPSESRSFVKRSIYRTRHRALHGATQPVSLCFLRCYSTSATMASAPAQPTSPLGSITRSSVKAQDFLGDGVGRPERNLATIVTSEGDEARGVGARRLCGGKHRPTCIIHHYCDGSGVATAANSAPLESKAAEAGKRQTTWQPAVEEGWQPSISPTGAGAVGQLCVEEGPLGQAQAPPSAELSDEDVQEHVIALMERR